MENADFSLKKDPRFWSWRNFFLRCDALLKIHNRFPFPPLRRRALAATLEQVPRGGDLVGRVELVMAQRPVHGLVIDLHVGQQVEQRGLGFERAAQSFDVLRERVGPGGQFRARGRRNGNARRWNATDVVELVVGGTVGKGGNGNGQ